MANIDQNYDGTTKLKDWYPKVKNNFSAINTQVEAHTSNKSNPHAVTKAQVGLSNVDNTSDANKPISTATQAALNDKADQADLTAHTSNKNNPHSVTKAQIGLSNVDNTSDANKPISNATQAALDDKADQADLTAHMSDTSNPHAVTKAQVGLANVDNTSDANKPISTATQAALDDKADKENAYGGGQLGNGANAHSGGAIGDNAYSADSGGAIGADTITDSGGAAGQGAVSSNGGAVGYLARTSDGFAGGSMATTVDEHDEPIDAIQLGTGTNSSPKTLQVYSYQLLDADGKIPAERLAFNTTNTLAYKGTLLQNADSELPASPSVGDLYVVAADFTLHDHPSDEYNFILPAQILETDADGTHAVKVAFGDGFVPVMGSYSSVGAWQGIEGFEETVEITQIDADGAVSVSPGVAITDSGEPDAEFIFYFKKDFKAGDVVFFNGYQWVKM